MKFGRPEHRMGKARVESSEIYSYFFKLKKLRLIFPLAVCTAPICMAQTPSAPHAVVVDGTGPWQSTNWSLGVTQFTSLLTDAGYQVQTVSPPNLATTQLAPGTVLAVPSLESLPLASFQAVASFIAAGGTLMASGGEPFRDPLYLTSSGQWLDQTAFLQALTPSNIALNPATATLTPYLGVQETVTETKVAGPDGTTPALDVQLQVPAQAQYVLYTAPVPTPAFGAGQTATILSTRGTAGQSMVVNWNETDGSRWVATIPLTTQWTKQVLLPSAFQYLDGGTNRAGTSFNPAAASVLFFGIITTFGANPGPLEFALTSIGTAAAPNLASFTPPIVETLSPSYKQYVTQRAGQTVRVPVSRGRGLSATAGTDGSYRVIGDPLAPSATRYVTNNGAVIIWLPWPQIQDPSRAQLVALLKAAPHRLYLVNAGPTELVVLPSEGITLDAGVANWAQSSAAANLVWSVANSGGTAVAKFTNALSVEAGQTLTVPPTDVGQLPAGDYTVTASLVAGTTQVDSIQSLVRVLDPTLAIQPSQRIVVSNSTFSTAGGKRVFLQGVNYWPRYVAGIEPAAFAQSWLAPQNYDPDVIEADLTLLASLHFNLVSLQYAIQPPGLDEARSLVDFLDRCRKHGIWANIAFLPFIPNTTPTLLEYDGELLGLNPNIASILQAAFLPGNDRVFAYDMLWEPGLFSQSARVLIDGAWRTWLTEQYGSTSNAESAWSFTAPLDAKGQVSNPLDSQFQNDGPWRVMVAAYRRFADDYLGHGLGVGARAIRAAAPGTLLSFRNGAGTWSVYNNQFVGYDLGVAAADVDFVSSELYGCCSGNGGVSAMAWPDARGYGFGAAYGHYRSGGKPVYWAEYGFNVGFTSTAASLASQASTADAMMRIVNEDGSAAASVWWMPGGWRSDSGDDYGILNPDGSPRASATTLAQWGETFAKAPPTQSGTPVTLTVDRDADARGQYGLFVNFESQYVQAKQAGSPVVLKDAGTGANTSTMPLVQVGNMPYSGTGPLKYANGEFAGIQVQCGAVNMQVENGGQAQVPAASTCQITPTLVNTGSASWLPTSQPKGGVVLHTSAGDLPIPSSLGYLQRVNVGPLKVSVGKSNIDITGRLNAQGVGTFGENLNLTLVPGSGVTPPSTLVLETSNLPEGVVGLAYSQALAATGGTAPYTWSVTKGTLPPGLKLQSSSGVISGTLTTAGSSTFTVQVKDSGKQSATGIFTIEVGASMPSHQRVVFAPRVAHAPLRAASPLMATHGS